METEKCLNCGGAVEKGYKYCLVCYKQYQEEKKFEEEQKKEGAVYKKIKKEKEQDVSFKGISGLIDAIEKSTIQLINQLEKNNNNLYRLIKQNDVILRENHKIKIVWEKTKADFIERKLK